MYLEPIKSSIVSVCLSVARTMVRSEETISLTLVGLKGQVILRHHSDLGLQVLVATASAKDTYADG